MHIHVYLCETMCMYVWICTHTNVSYLSKYICTFSGTIILRILIGSISEGIGIRFTYSALLLVVCIPGACLAAANSYIAVVLLRFAVGFAGGSFVLTQLWTTIMFDLNVVGIANATSAGWGNLGGGVAQVYHPFSSLH